MSILTCQIGQCGNQLGQAFYDKMASELCNADTWHLTAGFSSHFSFSDWADKKTGKGKSKDAFLSPEENSKKSYQESIPRANSVLIDMEPKVINSLLNRPGNLWAYDKNLAFCQQEGSGNNWAYGHYEHGPKCSEPMLEKFRILLERQDLVDGILFLQSLAGGTGSGIGSYLMNLLKDEYPELNLFTTVVLPRFSGEVILQFYNCVFS
jgi:tubulin delta